MPVRNPQSISPLSAIVAYFPATIAGFRDNIRQRLGLRALRGRLARTNILPAAYCETARFPDKLANLTPSEWTRTEKADGLSPWLNRDVLHNTVCNRSGSTYGNT